MSGSASPGLRKWFKSGKPFPSLADQKHVKVPNELALPSVASLAGRVLVSKASRFGSNPPAKGSGFCSPHVRRYA